MGALDEISRAIGTLEGQIRDQNEDLRDVRRDLGREIGELKERFGKHVEAADISEKDGVRRLQAIEARLDHLGKDAATSLAERDRRMSVRLALIGLVFTLVNVIIAAVGLLLR